MDVEVFDLPEGLCYHASDLRLIGILILEINIVCLLPIAKKAKLVILVGQSVNERGNVHGQIAD